MRNKLYIFGAIAALLAAWIFNAEAQNQDIRRGGGGGGSGTVTGITNAGNSSFSIINSSNSPVLALKSLSAGSNVTLTDQGTNIVVAATGGGSTSWPVTNAWVELQRIPIAYNIKTNTSSQIPLDSTKPQIGEGLPIWTNSITPLSTNSVIIVEFTGNYSCSSAINVGTAIFRNGAADAVGANSGRVGSANTFINVPCYAYYTNTALTTITFSYNFGPQSAATMYINSGAAGSLTDAYTEIFFSGGSIREVQLP